MKENSKRSGFTIVELLVLIAIIGILLGLMLPAVRRVGPAARRTQCMNNLRQIALASLNYESANMKFPSAMGLDGFKGVGSANQYSSFVQILPFLEQNHLYSAITKGESLDSVAIEPCPQLYGAILPHWNKPIQSYTCPAVSPAETDFLPIHYGLCIGDRARNIATPDSLRGGHLASTTISFSDMTDGSSNTIFAGEICSNNEDESESPFAVNQDESFLDDPSKCFDLVNKNGSNWSFQKGIHLSPIGRGGHWADGRAGVALFNTILPPKSPSVAIRGSVGVDGIYSATGPHSGGLSVVLFDGSTHFVDEDIDAGDSTQAAPTEEEMASGVPSPYGIWGAMGTINGGEDASLF